MRFIALAPVVLLLACSANGAGRALPPAPPDDVDDPLATSAGTQDALPRLTEDMAVPYFSGEAAARFALRDWRAARDEFASQLADADATDGPDRARLRLVIAVCDEQLGDHADAAAGFAYASEHLPALADYAHFHAALGYFRARDIDTAHEHAVQVSTDSRQDAENQLLIGDILRAGGHHESMVKHYEAYLKHRTLGPRLAEATFRLAQAYERTGRAVPDALARYRRIPIFAPLTDWSDRATERFDDLLAQVSAAERKQYETLTADEHIERGFVYYHAMRNLKSEAEFAAALEAPGLTDETACVAAYHRADSWFKERNRTKAAPLFDEAMALCDKTTDTTLRVKSAYQAGRSYARLDEREKAIARYAVAETFDHTIADDARMRQAEEYRDLDDQEKVTELLSKLPDKFPDGDMRAEATWRLAWRAYKDKHYEESIKWLQKQIEIMPIDQRWYGEGQAQYWLARNYAKLGKTDEAVASYEECVTLYPLSYYALLSLNRLREAHKPRFEKLVEQIAAAPAGYDAKAPDFAFAPRALYGEAGFLRGIELLKLGLGDEAGLELARVGLEIPAGRDEVTDPDEQDKVWAIAWLYDRAGRYDLSHWVTRWHVLGYKRHWPVGQHRARWLLGYPLAWTHLIEAAAKQHGYPWALQMGIMREESAFDPLRESYANAIGLTQMINSTATRFGKGTGIAPTRENLRDPEKNVIIGSNFLGFLHKLFEGRVGLMVPSYNAGEGATWRWLWHRHSPEWERDEWEEEIPGDQARNYTKRVVATYFIYSYLYKNEIPEMPQSVPFKYVPDRKIKLWKKRPPRD